MANTNGSNRFDPNPGEGVSHAFGSGNPTEILMNSISALDFIKMAVVQIPNDGLEFDDQRADGLFRILSAVEEALTSLKGRLEVSGATNG